jgi:6-hydroxypseudooxynicotine dehydrogenase subunit alpha
VKPRSFSYECPTTRDAALALLAKHREEAAVLAGGQSLVPLMNFRLVDKQVLIDINNISDLAGITLCDEHIRIGSMTRHEAILNSPLIRQQIPLISEAMKFVAHLQIRTRGTLGGNLCFAHPSSEMPAVMAALDAQMECESAEKGKRVIQWNKFFVSPMVNSLEPEELLCNINVPVPARNTGWCFLEVARRHGDFALAGAAVLLRLDRNGLLDEMKVSLCGMGDGPVRLFELEENFSGATPDDGFFGNVETWLSTNLTAPEELTLSSNNKKKIATTVIVRALARALERAQDSSFHA